MYNSTSNARIKINLSVDYATVQKSASVQEPKKFRNLNDAQQASAGGHSNACCFYHAQKSTVPDRQIVLCHISKNHREIPGKTCYALKDNNLFKISHKNMTSAKSFKITRIINKKLAKPLHHFAQTEFHALDRWLMNKTNTSLTSLCI